MYWSPQFDWCMVYWSRILILPDRFECRLRRCICFEDPRNADSSGHRIYWYTLATWLILRREEEELGPLICSFNLLIEFRSLMSFRLKWSKLPKGNRWSEVWSWNLWRGSWLSCPRGKNEQVMTRNAKVGQGWKPQRYSSWLCSKFFRYTIWCFQLVRRLFSLPFCFSSKLHYPHHNWLYIITTQLPSWNLLIS